MKRNFIGIALITPILLSIAPTTTAYAIESKTTVKVGNAYDEKSVYLTDVAKALGESVEYDQDFGDGFGTQVYLNGKKVCIYDNSGKMKVDGTWIDLKRDSSDSSDYSESIVHVTKLIKNDGDYLVPLRIIKNILRGNNTITFDESSYKLSNYALAMTSGNVKVTTTTGIGNTTISTSSTSNSNNTSDGYTPVYDYDLRDYEDAYIDKNNISRLTYDANLANMLEQQMEAERQANINEGWHTKDGKFYFLKNGIPIKGWYKDINTWYYFNKDGSMKTGWLKDGGDWYYFYDSGAMARSVYINGYYLNEYGNMTNDVPTNAPTGISYQELINRVKSIGYSHKTRYDQYSVGEKTYATGYEFQWYSKKYVDPVGTVVIRDDNTCHISADYNSDEPKFENGIYTILEWLLPTQVNTVYSKINSKPGQAQTIYADGRVVDVTYYQGGINFDIKNQ